MRLEPSKLRKYGFKKRISQRDVAKVSGLSYSTINTIYNGKATTTETAIKIAEALGVPLESITAKGDE